MLSARFRPTAATSMPTSPASGSLTGTSSICKTSGPPSLWNLTAFGIHLPPVCESRAVAPVIDWEGGGEQDLPPPVERRNALLARNDARDVPWRTGTRNAVPALD